MIGPAIGSLWFSMADKPLSTKEEVEALVGFEGPQVDGIDEVSQPMIRHWCEAMQDGNPLYTDAGYAAGSSYRRPIAPPAMLLSWAMNPLWPPREPPRGPLDRAMEILDRAGFTQIIIVGSTQKYEKPLFPGDRVSFTYRVEKVSDERQTMLGKGHFVTTVFTYTNQKGERVGTQTLTMLKYRT